MATARRISVENRRKVEQLELGDWFFFDGRHYCVTVMEAGIDSTEPLNGIECFCFETANVILLASATVVDPISEVELLPLFGRKT